MRFVVGMALALQLWAAASHAQPATRTGQTARLQSQQGPPDEAARPLFEEGRRAYEAGRYAEALDAFQQVFIQTGHPAMLFNISNAHARLGEYKRAGAALEQYLALVPDAPDRRALEDRIAAYYTQPDALALVEPPAPAPVEAAPQAEPPPPAAPAPVPLPAEPPASKGLLLGRTYTWLALGTSLVFATAAGLFWLDANQDYERLALTCGSTPAGCNDTQLEPLTRSITATNVCVVGFATTLVTAGILFAVEGESGQEAPPVRAALDVGPHGVALDVRGSL